MLASLTLVVWYRPWAAEPVLDHFWSPIFDGSGPVVLSVGQPKLASQTPLPEPNPSPNIVQHIQESDQVALSDAITLSQLSGLIGKRDRPYHVLGASTATLAELRQGPNVLVSGFDNPWTMRALDSLRFRFVHGPDVNLYWIEDRKKQGPPDYYVNFATTYSKLTQDYAIIARFSDPTTGQPTVIAAGIGENGTIAAGEFLTDPRYIKALLDKAPKDWASKNIEVVIGTQVIDGNQGPPRVMAVECW
jgi:hypothetical protein